MKTKTKQRKQNTKLFSISQHDCELAFTEWDKRFRKDPEKFMSEAVRLLKGNPKSYGESCAPYFLKLIKEIQGQ